MKCLILVFILFVSGFTASATDDVFSKFPDIKGFSKKLTPEIYIPDNLWDYIDGAADAYLGYDFTDLHMAEYSKGKKNSVRVEIYRHSNPQNAFGIYANERFPDYHFIDVGVQGYQQGSVLNFFTGDYYVKIYGSSESELIINAMKNIAGRLADNLGGNSGFPEVLSRFPGEGKTANKESYAAINFMGYSFYHSVFVSGYQAGDKSFRIFCFEGNDPEDCKLVLLKHAELSDKKMEGIEPGIINLQDPYNGKIWLLWKGNEIWGVVDLDDDKLAGEYLDRIEGK